MLTKPGMYAQCRQEGRYVTKIILSRWGGKLGSSNGQIPFDYPVAQERASATERRALLEIDQERTLRQKAEQALADLRAELAAVRCGRKTPPSPAPRRGAAVGRARHAQPATGGGRAGARARAGGPRRAAGGTGNGSTAGRAGRAGRCGSHRDATPSVAQAPGASDENQVQAGASLRGAPEGRDFSTARWDKPVDKPHEDRCPAGSSSLISF